MAAPDDAIESVRSGMALFALAAKNAALYPASNQIRQQALQNFKTWLDSFLLEYEKLPLLVEKDYLLVGTETVYQDKPGEQALIYPLFRDGIQWFEFNDGATADEVGRFLDLLNKFKILKEEAEDDLTTALWEADLPHIKYKTAEEFWATDPMADIASLANLSEASEDAAAAAYIKSGSDNVSSVLMVLSKKQDQSDESQPSGMHLHATAQGGGAGVDAALEALDAILSSNDPAFAGAAGAVQGESGDRPPAAANDQTRDEQTDDQASPASLFSEIMANLHEPADREPRKPASGLLAKEGAAARSASNKPIYVDEADADGDSSAPMIRVDDDDEGERSHTDGATAKSVFKQATYYEREGSEYLWPLAPSEEKILQAMVESEEHRNFTEDCLDILLEVIKASRGRSGNDLLLDFLADEVQYALSQADFYFIRSFLEQFSKVAASKSPEIYGPILHDLYARITTPEILGCIAQGWPDQPITDDSLLELRRFLLLLPPEAISALVPILAKTIDPEIEQILLEIVALEASQAKTNIAPLIAALKLSSILELIRILKEETAWPCPVSLLVGLSRHESAAVREEAAKALLENNPDNLKALFHLIDDPQPAVNRLICAHLGHQRSPLAEKVLTDYLSDTYFARKNQDKEQVLNCYRAFGRCASARSIPFLQEILMQKDWKSLLGLDNNWHRLGAALALTLMPPEWGAGDILKEAGQSRHRNIRQACQQALEDSGRRAGEDHV